jgi:hypothetical protein
MIRIVERLSGFVFWHKKSHLEGHINPPVAFHYHYLEPLCSDGDTIARKFAIFQYQTLSININHYHTFNKKVKIPG